ncbi:hypothetical protein [Natrarchaeobaculum sulfurireducens]|uniref:Uncharacterized protein n=1 Tax=Natrarchaeobaculum sulfurireducens TaxID=2044521 RepID=A0A346PIH6_9EURY|nr:hypothetical protein [Natrarchaeobaculum sulfurireducens]AXR79321.1 hypothetical protein AArc1_3013 [Natrarchaeobaculum sulfurireducens]
MSQRVILVGRRRPPSPWLAPAVSALGFEVATTVLTDRPEDGQYHLPPGALEQVELALERADGSMLVVDGRVHVGQLADLTERLGDVTVHDRRSVVWAWLEATNPAAEARLALRQARLERRLAERAGDRSRSPARADTRVADLERQCDRVRARLEDRQRAERTRIESAHTDVDGYVVLVDEFEPAPRIHSGIVLEGRGATPSTRVETTVVTVGTHRLAMTDVPSIPWAGSVPDWFEPVVPGAIAALERADLICSSTDDLATHLAARFDADPVVVPADEADTLRATLADYFTTTVLELSFPATDSAHAAVSWLYDRGDVTAISYGDRIELSVTVPERAVDEVGRRVREVDGRLERVGAETDE